MNLEKITEGIAEALFEEFGENYRIYGDKIEQGLEEPCFLILPINSGRNHVIGQRYEQKNSFDIHYFPETSNRSEINAIQERLYGALEYIKAGDSLLHGTNLNGDTVDGILHFFVDYDMFLLKRLPETEKMKKVKTEIRKKDEDERDS